MMKLLGIWAAVMVDDHHVESGWMCWGGAKVKTQPCSTTFGQELKDLEEAYQKGIITERQYKDAKEKLIEQRTKK